jgi:ATPase
MTESDLARPIIVIKDLESGKPEYEIYTFGEQIVVMPVGVAAKKRKPSASDKALIQKIQREVSKYARGPVEVEMQSETNALVRVKDKDIPAVVGRSGKTINNIERATGVHIDVRPYEEEPETERMATLDQEEALSPGQAKRENGIPLNIEETKKHVVLDLGKQNAGQTVEVTADGEYLFTATVGRTGAIKIPRGSSLVDRLLKAQSEGASIEAYQV